MCFVCLKTQPLCFLGDVDQAERTINAIEKLVLCIESAKYLRI